MPELPEVEHLRRTLTPLIVGERVERARVIRRDVLVAPGDPAGGFSRSRSNHKPRPIRKALLVEGARFTSVERHGKQLALVADSGAIGVHLGMTGRLTVEAASGPLPPHAHAVWRLESGRRLVFADARRFGGLWLHESLEELRSKRWLMLGPDALSIRARTLMGRVRRTNRAIKGVLLDQRVVAGVGNIYADEALHRSGVSPHRIAGDLEDREIVTLAAQIRCVLRDAIARGGSSIRDYVDASGERGNTQSTHRVYGRAGQECLRCETPLIREQVAQRTTVWCPECQL